MHSRALCMLCALEYTGINRYLSPVRLSKQGFGQKVAAKRKGKVTFLLRKKVRKKDTATGVSQSQRYLFIVAIRVMRTTQISG